MALVWTVLSLVVAYSLGIWVFSAAGIGMALGAAFFYALAALIAKHLKGELDVPTACMAKYWVTELQGEVVDKCLQLHGGAGYMNEYLIARIWRDARVMRIFGGSSEIMKELMSRSI